MKNKEYIFEEMISKISSPDYQHNHPDFGWKTDSEFRRSHDSDKIHDMLNNTDWDKESNYHNSYQVNGKENKGRTIKLKK